MQRLLGLIQSYRLSVSFGGVVSSGLTTQDAMLLQAALRAINNLALNESNQEILQVIFASFLHQYYYLQSTPFYLKLLRTFEYNIILFIDETKPFCVAKQKVNGYKYL